MTLAPVDDQVWPSPWVILVLFLAWHLGANILLVGKTVHHCEKQPIYKSISNFLLVHKPGKEILSKTAEMDSYDSDYTPPNLFVYEANFPLAIASASIFGIIMIVTAIQSATYRTRWMFNLVAAAFCEYIRRFLSCPNSRLLNRFCR